MQRTGRPCTNDALSIENDLYMTTQSNGQNLLAVRVPAVDMFHCISINLKIFEVLVNSFELPAL